MICLFRKRYTLHVFEAKDGWRFHAKAGNGEILFASESYTRKEDAVRACKALSKARLVLA